MSEKIDAKKHLQQLDDIHAGDHEPVSVPVKDLRALLKRIVELEEVATASSPH